MSATTQFLGARPNILPILQASTITSLSVISGVSICLTAWVMPIIRTARDSETKVAQFNLTTAKGWAYLHTFSQVQGASLAAVTYLTSQHPNPAIAEKWKIWAVAMGIVAFAWPFERLAIFPTNDKIEEIGVELKEGRTKGGEGEVDELLSLWGMRNVVRASLPLTAAITGLYSVLS